MVLKLINSVFAETRLFESSVNSDGSQTFRYVRLIKLAFESSVNSDGSQTNPVSPSARSEFESSVNSDGSQTLSTR
mgnify:CR=1 FL=1